MYEESAGVKNTFIILKHYVRKTFRIVNTRKAAEPHSIPAWVPAWVLGMSLY